jgi:hypothetical protein
VSSSAPAKPTSGIFDHLNPQEIMTSYYGYWYRLQDMQQLQAGGKRIPGGLSGRIELANLHWQMANHAFDDLVHRDPAKARAVQEWLALSSEPTIHSKAIKLQAALEDRQAS